MPTNFDERFRECEQQMRGMRVSDVSVEVYR
jgi:hypothetical protein